MIHVHVKRTGLIVTVCLGLLFQAGPASGGIDDDFGSAAIIALGGAYAADPDGAGLLWINPAMRQLSAQDGSGEISYRSLYGLSELEEITAGVWHRVARRIGLGVGFSRFGESGLYLETQGVLAAAFRLRPGWTVGTTWEFQRVEYGQNESRYNGANLALALAARPVSSVVAGAALRRIDVDPLYTGENRNPAVEISAAWSAPPDITLAGIWAAQPGHDRFGLGQRLRLGRGVEFLSGLTFDPIRYSLGGRIAYWGGTIDYAYQSHADLGGTHLIGFGWRW
ncbi:MAG: hypothetical protein AB1792_11825 [Candidatus Zixiibacteriota bacterium]